MLTTFGRRSGLMDPFFNLLNTDSLFPDFSSTWPAVRPATTTDISRWTLDFDQILKNPARIMIDEDKHKYLVTVETPLPKDSLRTEVRDDYLIISGDYKEEEVKPGFERRKMRSFVRTMQVPDDVDLSKVAARYEDHAKTLIIDLPKIPGREETQRGRKIEIGGSQPMAHVESHTQSRAASPSTS